MRHDEQAFLKGIADRDQAALGDRMVRIIERRGKRVIEHRNSFIERDVVFGLIFGRLRPVPFELHLPILG